MKPAYSRALGGLVYPIAVLIFGMLLLANIESSAGAAEFAALGVFLVLLFAIPVTLIGNYLLLKPSGSALDHFKRGMILPGVFLAWTVVYQTGLWDRLT